LLGLKRSTPLCFLLFSLLALVVDLLLLLIPGTPATEDPTNTLRYDRSQSRKQTKKPRVRSLGLAQKREQGQGEKGKQSKLNHGCLLEVPHDRLVDLIALTRVGINDRCGPRTPTAPSSSLIDLLLEVLIVAPVHTQEVPRGTSSELPALDVLLLGLAQNVCQALREGIGRGSLECLLLGSRDATPEQPPPDGVVVYPSRRLSPLTLNRRAKRLTSSVHEALGCLATKHSTQGVSDLVLERTRFR
jgi:hypothetical protein